MDETLKMKLNFFKNAILSADGEIWRKISECETARAGIEMGFLQHHVNRANGEGREVSFTLRGKQNSSYSTISVSFTGANKEGLRWELQDTRELSRHLIAVVSALQALYP